MSYNIKLVAVYGTIIYDTKEKASLEEKDKFAKIINRLLNLNPSNGYSIVEDIILGQCLTSKSRIREHGRETPYFLLALRQSQDQIKYTIAMRHVMICTTTVNIDPKSLGVERPTQEQIEAFKEFLSRNGFDANYGEHILVYDSR